MLAEALAKVALGSRGGLQGPLKSSVQFSVCAPLGLMAGQMYPAQHLVRPQPPCALCSGSQNPRMWKSVFCRLFKVIATNDYVWLPFDDLVQIFKSAVTLDRV